MCISECIYVLCVHMFVWVHVQVCMWKLEVPARCFPWPLSLVVSEGSSLIAPELIELVGMLR